MSVFFFGFVCIKWELDNVLFSGNRYFQQTNQLSWLGEDFKIRFKNKRPLILRFLLWVYYNEHDLSSINNVLRRNVLFVSIPIGLKTSKMS